MWQVRPVPGSVPEQASRPCQGDPLRLTQRSTVMILATLQWLSRRFRPAGRPLFRPEMLPDPYPAYHQLRREDPVHWDPAEDRWVLTRYADVVAVLRSPAASSDR